MINFALKSFESARNCAGRRMHSKISLSTRTKGSSFGVYQRRQKTSAQANLTGKNMDSESEKHKFVPYSGELEMVKKLIRYIKVKKISIFIISFA